jgi:predicted ribosomally synthesized peptide with nif11-like leader
MSLESAKAFYQKFTTDEAFRSQLQSAAEEERTSIIQEAGYDFIPEEWDVVIAEVSEAVERNEELDEAALEAVSGGGILPNLLVPFIGTKYGAPNLWDLDKK